MEGTGIEHVSNDYVDNDALRPKIVVCRSKIEERIHHCCRGQSSVLRFRAFKAESKILSFCADGATEDEAPLSEALSGFSVKENHEPCRIAVLLLHMCTRLNEASFRNATWPPTI
jgi:hypothetical protein